MDIYELKRKHEAHHPNSHFFDRQTLKFFGETLAKMYVYKNPEMHDGKLCWLVRSKQKFDCMGKMMTKNSFHWFDTETFDEVY